MSLLAQTVEAIEDAMKLADDVRRAADTLKELAQEIRDHDRRITSVEGQWETPRSCREGAWNEIAPMALIATRILLPDVHSGSCS